MTERIPQSSYQIKPARQVMVPAEDADMIRKVHRILKAGKDDYENCIHAAHVIQTLEEIRDILVLKGVPDL